VSATSAVLRWVGRLPVILYAAHLGWLLGDRFLLLTDRGRHSGRLRKTVLEILYHVLDAGLYVVASGRGEQAAWFVNVQQHPDVVVTIRTRRLAARATRLTNDEAIGVLSRDAKVHSLAFGVVGQLLSGRRLRPTTEDCARFARRVPLVALHTRALGSSRIPRRRLGRASLRPHRVNGRIGALPA
jgi:deazaflavin-dependent oxidoreductase (nitroreductase family)